MISAKSIVRDIERRIIAHFMDLLVLSILNHDGSEISGYDLIEYLHSKFGILMSPGTVYSCIHAMEREDLLKGRHNGKKRIYTLSKHGREMAKTIQKADDIVLKSMSNLLHKNKH
jgi:DNA-binding PadR family transcriptional regulator